MRLAFRLMLVALVLAIATPVAIAAVRPALEDRSTSAAQARLRDELLGEPVAQRSETRRRAVAPVARPARVGHALGTLRVPRFGADWEWVLLEGADDEVIADGPGHYADTALPGARGNVGIAAHRAGHGDPFLDFDTLRPGDRVHVTQAGTTWTYRLTTRPEIIPVTATWVLRPHVIDGTDHWRRELTLTTCWPKYGSSKRMYVRAVLDHADRHADKG